MAVCGCGCRTFGGDAARFGLRGCVFVVLSEPFNHGEIGVLMRKGQDNLLELVNDLIRQMKADGSLLRLHEKYGLVYAY